MQEERPFDLINSAYRKLSRAELLLFLKVRNLPTTGTDSQLASRLANHDIHLFHIQPSSQSLTNGCSQVSKPAQKRKPASKAPDLPVEVLAYIMDIVGDWELSQAVGIPSTTQRPLEWSRASSMDYAMIVGHMPFIRASNPALHPPTTVGADLAIRFEYLNVLEYFLYHHHDIFLSVFKNDLIPIKASHYGRTSVLSWWKHAFEHHPELLPPPKQTSIGESIDGASRNGQVESLEWWVNSGLPLEYSEAALEYASAKNQIAVLEWWKRQYQQRKLPLKIGRVMDMASTAGHVAALEWWATSQLEPKYDRHALQHASCHGKIEVLNWWLGSGLPLSFDQDALTGATRHNRPEVLEWWDKSGLPIQYRMCDIEEALEDAIGGGESARRWWRSKGIDFNANDKEWMKLQNLN
jgi:hypothetical protein